MDVTLDIKPLSEWGIPFAHTFMIAGPCSAESEEQLLATARALKPQNIQLLRAGIWKPRTRPNSFEGVGSIGLDWLVAAREETGIPVSVEVANPKQVEECLEKGIDVLWIGARTTPNPFAMQDIAQALKGVDIPVMVKNPINADLQLWIGALERLNLAGVKKLLAIHRGFSSYKQDLYRNQPLWRLPLELKRMVPGIPLVCDPSHICGKRDLIYDVAQKALDLLFDGLMIEVHADPEKALSDSKQQFDPAAFAKLVERLVFKTPTSNQTGYLESIRSLRDEIDGYDRKIIELLALRMENAREISVHKMKHNISIFQPDRWDEVLKTRVNEALEKGIREDFIVQLFQLVHEESIRQQENVLVD